MLREAVLALAVVFGTAAHAEEYRILDAGPEALQIRVDLIQQAKHEIVMSYFIWDEDRTGIEVLSLLREKARAGVSVKILVDAQFNSIPKAMRRLLRDDGVEIRDYNPVGFFKLRRFTRRLHDKLFIVDGVHLITGGRNIEDLYYDLDEITKVFLDRDLYLHGPLVEKIREYYFKVWNSADVRANYSDDQDESELASALSRLDQAYSGLSRHPFLKLNTGRDWTNGSDKADLVSFLHDPVGVLLPKKLRTHKVKHALYEVFDSAKESILIENPYLVVNRELRHELKKAIDRGVHVRILTSNFSSTDGLLPQAAYIHQKRRLVKMGVELWEYRGPRRLHSKSFLIDGKTAVIGSYNLDPRSANLNTEVLAVLEDESAARELGLSFELNLERSFQIGRDGKPIGFQRRYPDASLKDVILTKMMSFILVPIFRGQL